MPIICIYIAERIDLVERIVFHEVPDAAGAGSGAEAAADAFVGIRDHFVVAVTFV